MRTIGVFLALAVLITVSAVQSDYQAMAQGQIRWSVKQIPPTNETTGESTVPSMPSLVIDRAEWVHLFWPEAASGSARTLFHVQTRGEAWEMNDVLMMPQTVNRAFVAVDKENNLHAVWLEPGVIYYSTARAPQSLNPLAWSKPRAIVEGNPASPTLAIDGDSRLHLLYADRNKPTAIRYTSSVDGGLSWSSPEELFVAPANELVADLPQLAVAENGDLHAVWFLLHDPEMYGGLGVYYARSFDHGHTWSEGRRLDRMNDQEPDEGAWLASIIVRGRNEVHVVWDAHSLSGRRRHRWSSDGGATWSGTEAVMGELVAQTGINPMVADSSGTLYLFGSGTFQFGTPAGVYFSTWNGNSWGSPQTVAVSSEGDPHYLSVAVSEGNRLHVAWLAGGIWYATARSDAPATPAPAGGMEEMAQSGGVETLTSPSATISAPVPDSTPLPDKLPPIAAPAPSSVAGTDLRLVVGIMPAFILVLAVVVIQSRRQRH